MTEGEFTPFIEGLIRAEEHDRKLLKPCPFCGSTKVFCEKEFFATDTIVCPNCGLAIFSVSHKDAIKKWNRRVKE